MTAHKFVGESSIAIACVERRNNRPDRRIKGERRGNPGPNYTGQVRRMTIERRMRTDSRIGF